MVSVWGEGGGGERTEIQVRTSRDYRYRSSACAAGSHDGPLVHLFLRRSRARANIEGVGGQKNICVIALLASRSSSLRCIPRYTLSLSIVKYDRLLLSSKWIFGTTASSGMVTIEPYQTGKQWNSFRFVSLRSISRWTVANSEISMYYFFSYDFVPSVRSWPTYSSCRAPRRDISISGPLIGRVCLAV